MHPDLMAQAIQARHAYQQPTGTQYKGVTDFQLSLIDEEYKEFLEAYSNDFPYTDQLKELADLVYVCFQFAAARGWELDEALHRVHVSNISKLVDGEPLKNEVGKVLKGPDYEPPYLEDLI